MNNIDFTLNEKAMSILNNPLLRKRAVRAHSYYMEVRNEIKLLGYNPYKSGVEDIYKAFRIDSRIVEGAAGELGISDAPSGYWSEDAWMLNLERIFFGRRVRIATEHPRTKRCIAEFLLAEHVDDLTVEQYIAVWTNYAVTVQTTDEENQALARGAQKTQHFFDDWQRDTYPQHNIKLLYKPRVNSDWLREFWLNEYLRYCEERDFPVDHLVKIKYKIAKFEEKRLLKEQQEQEQARKRAERERKRLAALQIKEEKRLAREAKKAAKLNKGKKA